MDGFFGVLVGLFLLAALGQIVWYVWVGRRRRRLVGRDPVGEPLVYLDGRMAVAPVIMGRKVPEGYRLASLFFGTGLIDRTETLDQGFDYQVLDPIPAPEPVPPMAELLRRRAAELRMTADRARKPVRLFWSGGIDSTAAACALLEAFIDAPEQLEIVYTRASAREYRLFHQNYVAPHPRSRRIGSVRGALDDGAILCTGEHGDQLFGSMKAQSLAWRDLRAPWEKSFPRILAKQLGGAERGETTLRYLEPQIRACPIALPRLFDLLWWLNFSLKWQAVSLRMLADGRPGAWALRDQTEHFFRTDAFQRWALTNPDKRVKGDWASYKYPLKDAILSFTGDHAYHQTKEKERSLRGGLGARALSTRGLALGATLGGAFGYQEFNQSLRSEGSWFSVTFSSEARLWSDLNDDGE